MATGTSGSSTAHGGAAHARPESGLLVGGLSGFGAAAVAAGAASFGAAWPIVLAAGAVVAGAGVAVLLKIERERRERVQHALAVVERLGSGGFDAVDADELERIGPLGHGLIRLLSHQNRRNHALETFLGHLDELPARIASVNQGVEASSSAIEESVEETASLLAHINSSIRGINSEVESLGRSTEEASASIMEMGSSIDEVARNSASLHDSVDSSTSSIHEISASIRQVAESADAVQGMAEESAAAMVQMDRAIQEVSQHVSEASQLTERVASGAEAGSAAVSTTIDGIAEIRRQTLASKGALEKLTARISEIGEIVDVIGGINDETNLLSLNAAIIAAQAGEQGKAFAVVANHVKTLAQRTAQSTKEIEALIGAVQAESRHATDAMGAGIEAVETGVERSRLAGEELVQIRGSAQDANQRVAEIARATGEQTRNSKHVAEAAQRTSSMVQQITTAMAEQSRASEILLQNAESALDLCRQVHRSTEEQRESSQFIRASVSAITEMISSIQRNTESHSAASEAVSEAVSRILETARTSSGGTRELLEQLAILREEAQRLERRDDEAPAGEPVDAAAPALA